MMLDLLKRIDDALGRLPADVPDPDGSPEEVRPGIWFRVTAETVHRRPAPGAPREPYVIRRLYVGTSRTWSDLLDYIWDDELLPQELAGAEALGEAVVGDIAARLEEMLPA